MQHNHQEQQHETHPAQEAHHETKAQHQEAHHTLPQQAQPFALNVLYSLPETDGMLIACRTAKHETAFIPLNLLIQTIGLRVEKSLRKQAGHS